MIFNRIKVAKHLGDGISMNTIRHNIRGSGELSSPRSHLLIRPIITLDSVRRNVRNLKVLTIGPRGDGEIFNLVGYGFSRKNVTGLDLFSFSRHIDVGDMHNMDYEDDQFDIVISGWVLGYSDDKKRCADEMKRVCKKGGIVAIGNGYYELTKEEIIQQGGLEIGSNEKVTNLDFIQKLFDANDVVFSYDGSLDHVSGAPLILVFRN
ncbi:MAG: SAM-dependent methyltransferase [Paracoccaceae bacterium]|mgnify:CR=1 FL=1|jgi:SAM-dependent methyltransferase